jgi:hypothetical protein
MPLPEQTRQQRKLWHLSSVHAKDQHMRDYRDAKAMAQALRAALAAMDFKITVSQSLELIAQAFGVADWNTLSAAIRAQLPPAAAGSGKTPGLSGELESLLNKAFSYARGQRHELITVEHLLLFLLEDADASRALQASGINLRDLRKKLSAYVDNDLNIRPADATDVSSPPKPNLGFQRVMQRAVFHVWQSGTGVPVKSLNVLVAAFSEKESYGVKLVNEQGVTRADVINYIARGIVRGGGDPAPGGRR